MQDFKIRGRLEEVRGIIHIKVEWRDAKNNRQRKSISTGLPVKGNKRKAEPILQNKLAEIKAELMRKSAVADDSTLFADWLLTWLDYKKATLSESSYQNYAGVVQGKLVPYFRNLGLLLCDITQDEIQEFYHYAAEENNISANTIRHYHAYISGALKYAVKQKYLSHNPADYVDLPKDTRREPNFYNAKEVKMLLETVMGTALEIPVVLTCYYGFRRSEVLGLTWDAVDFANNTITVKQKAFARHNGTGHAEIVMTNKLKTESSYRTLPLMPPVRDYLLQLQKRQEQNRERFGNAYIHTYDDYICVRDNGELVKLDFISQNFSSWLASNGLRTIRFHDLRHTCATLLINSGKSPKQVQEWLGHSNFSTTADIYSHITVQSKIEMGETMVNLLAG